MYRGNGTSVHGFRNGSKALMQVVDSINARQGRGTIRLGTDHERGGWTMRQNLLSPSYTTSWQGLPVAKA